MSNTNGNHQEDSTQTATVQDEDAVQDDETNLDSDTDTIVARIQREMRDSQRALRVVSVFNNLLPAMNLSDEDIQDTIVHEENLLKWARHHACPAFFGMGEGGALPDHEDITEDDILRLVATVHENIYFDGLYELFTKYQEVSRVMSYAAAMLPVLEGHAQYLQDLFIELGPDTLPFKKLAAMARAQARPILQEADTCRAAISTCKVLRETLQEYIAQAKLEEGYVEEEE